MEVGFFVKAFFDQFQSKKKHFHFTLYDTFLGNTGLIQLKDALKKQNQISNKWKYNFKPFQVHVYTARGTSPRFQQQDLRLQERKEKVQFNIQN